MEEGGVTEQAYADLKAWLETHGDEIAEVAKNEASALYGEIIAAGFVGALFWLVVGAALLAVAVFPLAYIVRHAGKFNFEHADNISLWMVVSALFSVPLLFFGIPTFFCAIHDLLYVSVAPRLYVLEQIAEML